MRVLLICKWMTTLRSPMKRVVDTGTFPYIYFIYKKMVDQTLPFPVLIIQEQEQWTRNKENLKNLGNVQCYLLTSTNQIPEF